MRTIERAASLLNISEHRLFTEAYLTYFGDRAELDDIDDWFAQFKMYGDAPFWAHDFAKTVLNDIAANRQVTLNSFCLVNLSPRTGDKPELTFTIQP